MGGNDALGNISDLKFLSPFVACVPVNLRLQVKALLLSIKLLAMKDVDKNQHAAATS